MRITIKHNYYNYAKTFENKTEFMEFIKTTYANRAFGENYHLDRVRLCNHYSNVSIFQCGLAIERDYHILKNNK